MFRERLSVLLIAASLGCGSSSPARLPVGFVNQTQHVDADLMAIWKAAQQSVAQEIDLNPVEQALHGAEPDVLPGDPRALSVQPRQIRVASEPDVASSVLLAQTGIYRADPTGLIACSQPCNVRYATAYSRYAPPLTKYAASWEAESDNFTLILQYEFENHILSALGYNMRWR